MSEDFAKQLLVLLGTLMTAITSFYLGAGTATSAAAAVQTSDASDSVPRLTGVNPTQHSLGTGSTIRLEVMGSNLNTITHAKIVRAGVQVIAKNVKSSPTSLTCDVEIDATVTPPGDAPWDVVVDDGKSKFATLPAALTIKA